MAVLSAIEILEQRLQVDASNLNSSAVLVQHEAEVGFVTVAILKVLATRKERVVLSNGRHTACRHLVDTRGGEGLVNRLAESDVVKELLRVVGFVFG
jgi:hypothetical protein